jgi:hypothetical protein
VESGVFARISGVLPDVAGGTNTSLSVFHGGFHLLVDAGNGVAASIKKGAGVCKQHACQRRRGAPEKVPAGEFWINLS